MLPGGIRHPQKMRQNDLPDPFLAVREVLASSQDVPSRRGLADGLRVAGHRICLVQGLSLLGVALRWPFCDLHSGSPDQGLAFSYGARIMNEWSLPVHQDRGDASVFLLSDEEMLSFLVRHD